jgi:hypothetical protein
MGDGFRYCLEKTMILHPTFSLATKTTAQTTTTTTTTSVMNPLG